ncbi:hypothetical protein R4B61_00440 [Fructilactobacillus vespulae]|uniref:hypothetical protein n=1 Tax=Fructilactobacillus vespulae TaxID=1249630 RepID=UPI0039B62B4B
MELIVFTANGSTYQFNDVTNFKNTSYGFSFDYFGKSTQKTRTAYFNNQSTAGYAILKDEIKKEATKEHKRSQYEGCSIPKYV